MRILFSPIEIAGQAQVLSKELIKLGRVGRNYVKNNHDSKKNAKRLLDIYKKL